jgi:tyrosine-protein kinase Etk/Wzc
VLLIDGDTQAPQIASLLGIDGCKCGRLTAVLRQTTSLAESVVPYALPGVDLLVPDSRAPYESREALNYESAADLLKQARQLYDHVVIDTPPALGAADVLEWARLSDGIVLTSLVGYSDMTAMDLTCRRLKDVANKVTGVVVSNVPRNDSYFSYSTLSTAPEGLSPPPGVRRVKTLAKRGRPVVSVPRHESEPDDTPSGSPTPEQHRARSGDGGPGETP